MASTGAQIEISQPRLFRAGAVLAVNAYGILLCIPVIVSVLLMSLLKVSLLSLLFPFVAIAGAAYFLPFGFGNAYVARLVGKLAPAPAANQPGFIVQLALAPRIRSGIRAVVEDADDIGVLSITDTVLVFQGDSIKLSVPFEHIRGVRRRNIGLRGLFLYGPCVAVEVTGLGEFKELEFAERSSWLLPTSRKTTNKLADLVMSAVARAGAGARGRRQSGGN